MASWLRRFMAAWLVLSFPLSSWVSFIGTSQPRMKEPKVRIAAKARGVGGWWMLDGGGWMSYRFMKIGNRFFGGTFLSFIKAQTRWDSTIVINGVNVISISIA